MLQTGTKRFRTHILGQNCLYFKELDSTNTYLKEHGGSLAHGTTVIAGRQTQGRGRLGRAWSSDEHTALYMSVLLKNIPQPISQSLPSLCGLATVKALEKLTGREFLIKWPNDVICLEKKVVGILCEGRLCGEQSYYVCGIGVNVLQDRAFFARNGLDHGGSILTQTHRVKTLEAVAESILIELEALLDVFVQEGFTPLLPAYKRHCVNIGREVRVITGETEQHGICVDVCADGSMLVDFCGQTKKICAGETSVRGFYGYV